jgi:hypothetical protein
MQPALTLQDPTSESSSQDHICELRKHLVSKLQGLVARLQALTDAAALRTEHRGAVEADARQQWLNSEGRRAMLRRSAERERLDVEAALKRAVGLRDVVDDDRARLAALRANATAQLREMDEEEAMIREQLALTMQAIRFRRAARLRERARKTAFQAHDHDCRGQLNSCRIAWGRGGAVC